MEEKEINYALDPEQDVIGQPFADDVMEGQQTLTMEGQVVEQPTEVTTAPTVETPTVPDVLNIDGIGEVKIDEIKEWKSGYLRQSDYTKKTQELAEQRKETERAVEFYKYMESNPHLIEALRQVQSQHNVQAPSTPSANPYQKEVEALKTQLAQIELNNTITSLKTKYPDFNEVEVLNEAQKRGLSDLEFTYKAMKSESAPDVATLTQQIRNQILQELQQNKEATQTIIGGKGGTPQQNKIELTPQQIAIARAQGMTPEEYAKWM